MYAQEGGLIGQKVQSSGYPNKLFCEHDAFLPVEYVNVLRLQRSFEDVAIADPVLD